MHLGLGNEVHWGERGAVQIREAPCVPKGIVLTLLQWLGQTQNQLLHPAAEGPWVESQRAGLPQVCLHPDHQ